MSFLDNIQIVGAKMDEFEQAKKEHDALLQKQKEAKDAKQAAEAAKRKLIIKKQTPSMIIKEDRRTRWESARTSRESAPVRTTGRVSTRQTAMPTQQNFEVTVTSKTKAYMTNQVAGLSSMSGRGKVGSTRPQSLQGLPRRDDCEDAVTDKKGAGKPADKSVKVKDSPRPTTVNDVGSISTDESANKKTPNYTTFLVSTGKAVFPQKNDDSVATGNDVDSGSSLKDRETNAQAESTDISGNGDTPGGKQDGGSDVDGSGSAGMGNAVGAGSDVAGGSINVIRNDIGETKKTNRKIKKVDIHVTQPDPNSSEAESQSKESEKDEDDDEDDDDKSKTGSKSTKQSGSLMPGNIEGDRPLSHPAEVTQYLRSVYKLVDTPTQLYAFQVCDEFIDSISCLSGENSWMFCDGNRLILVNKEGDKQRSIQLRGKIGDFCTLPSGEVLLTHMDDCCVYSIQANGVMTLQFKTEPLLPVAIQPTSDGNLLITLADVWDYEIHANSQRQLRRYSREGTVMNTLEFGSNGERLFSKPGRVKVCSNNSNIAVCNFVNDKPGDDQVIIIDKNFKFLFRSSERYTIPSHLQPQVNHVIFDDLVFDSGDNIITVETSSNSVQLLDPNFRYIKTLYKDPSDYEQPMSVALDTEGNLWIGFQRGHVMVLKYRTQEVDSQEVDLQEVDSQEVDLQEVGSQEVDSQKVDSQEVDA